MMVTATAGSFKIEAVLQIAPNVWLIREYSGNSLVPINTYATNGKGLRRAIRSLQNEEEGR